MPLPPPPAHRPRWRLAPARGPQASHAAGPPKSEGSLRSPARIRMKAPIPDKEKGSEGPVPQGHGQAGGLDGGRASPGDPCDNRRPLRPSAGAVESWTSRRRRQTPRCRSGHSGSGFQPRTFGPTWRRYVRSVAIWAARRTPDAGCNWSRDRRAPRPVGRALSAKAGASSTESDMAPINHGILSAFGPNCCGFDRISSVFDQQFP